MTTILFNVTGYFVRFFNRSNPGIPVDRNRYIRLQYAPTNNVTKLDITFRPDSEVNTTVGTITKRADSTVEINARLPVLHYESYLDLLRYEKPLLAWARYDEPLTVNVGKPLIDFDFGNGPFEPTGEGPVDTSA